MMRHGVLSALFLVLIAACTPSVPGYSKSQPSHLTCGCDGAQACYDGAAHLAESRGETADTGEELLYLAQCACFEGSMAGCNTIAHFAKDYVAACEAGKNAKDSCTIAGMVHLHGVRVPDRNGRSFEPDPAAASAAFAKGCEAGAKPACDHAAK